MSREKGASEAVELVERLKSLVADVAAREEAISREFKTLAAVIEKARQKDLSSEEVRLAEAIERTKTAHLIEENRLISKFERRLLRLKKAYKSAQRTTSEKIEKAEGRRKYRVQKGTLDTEKKHDEDLKQNDSALADIRSQLSHHRDAFAVLEEDASVAFRGYKSFRKLIATSVPAAPPGDSIDEFQLLNQLGELHARATEDLRQFSRLFFPKVFRVLPVWLWGAAILVSAGGLPFVLPQLGWKTISHLQAAEAGGVCLGLLLIVYFVAGQKAKSLAKKIGAAFSTARNLETIAGERAHARHAHEIERIESETHEKLRTFREEWNNASAEAASAQSRWPARIDAKSERAEAKNASLSRKRLDELERNQQAALDEIQAQFRKEREMGGEASADKVRRRTAEHESELGAIRDLWLRGMETIFGKIESMQQQAAVDFLDWNDPAWKNWKAPTEFLNAVKIGSLEIEAARLAEKATASGRLTLPEPPVISVPLLLTYPAQGAVLFESAKPSENIIGSLNNIIFRLLSTSPLGKLSFTIIDPVRLGQNFAAITHLADYEESLLNGRIRTESSQIEECLADLNQHMEKVIQMYLRNEYKSIVEYNVKAGKIAEKYHFLVVADFPANFTDNAIRRLHRIAASGARCGVYTLIHWDHRHRAPSELIPDELRNNSVVIELKDEEFLLVNPLGIQARVLLDPPPPPDVATAFLRSVGGLSRGSNRVEVPFGEIMPKASEIWSVVTTDELRVPIGRSGATKLQYLEMGRGTKQHALVAGKTGSGKSTLFHVIITNLALWCSPEQVEFYLIDFKKGVEFKCYADNRLPHAKVVAIESDREFGLSVLERVDEELRRRGDLFRKLGVQDVAGFKRANKVDPMPRSLLLIDEFQEFFVEEDKTSQEAAVLLDRIVRQGRAFGIHVILGSQTLGGAYTLARTTIGQMVIRIALQCNETDAYLIMDENNSAPRLLSRPGEGIYNDMAGSAEGNSPFQVVWLPDDERDSTLATVRALAERKPISYPGPIVFEGNAPADVRENLLLAGFLTRSVLAIPTAARLWMGAPNSIKGPTEAVFRGQSANNLLIVGQRAEPVLAILSVGILSLAAQYPKGAARFILFHGTQPGSPERTLLDRIALAMGDRLRLAKAADAEEVMAELVANLEQQTDGTPTRPTFLFIHELQNFKKLKPADEFSFNPEEGGGPNAAAQLNKLFTDGPGLGTHVIVTIDTFNNVNRFLGRRALSEFGMRVLFQMGANDSSSLCDDPKASNLGLHRALLYDEQEGYLETFRPYALPGADWIEEMGNRFAGQTLANVSLE